MHEKDLEILLRAIALVLDGENYREPMSTFLNQFSKKAKTLPNEKIKQIEEVFNRFFNASKELSLHSFVISKTNRFNIAIFEAVFRAFAYQTATCAADKQVKLEPHLLQQLKADQEFLSATQFGVGRTAFVERRFARAKHILFGV